MILVKNSTSLDLSALRMNSMVWATSKQGHPLSTWGFCPQALVKKWNSTFSSMVLLDYFCRPWGLRDWLCDPSSCSTTQHSLLSSICPSIPLQLMSLLHSYTSALWTSNLSSRSVGSSPRKRQGQDCSTPLGRLSLLPNRLSRRFPTLLCWSISHIPSRFLLLVALQPADMKWAFYGIGLQWNARQKSCSATQSLR